MEALKSIISIAANHKEPFAIMHIDVSRAHFHAKDQRFVRVRLPVEGRMGADAGKMCLLNTACVAHGTLQAIGSVIGKSMPKAGASTWAQLEESVSPGKASSFRNDTLW